MDSPVILIPARHASSRFPGKALAPIRGATGESQTLIERTWRAARAVPGIGGVWVATDDARIADVASGFGADVVMTGNTCANGTERCAEALERLGIAPPVVVNLQGDAPLTPPWFIKALLGRVDVDKPVATPILPLDEQGHRLFLAERSAGRVGGTTVVTDCHGRALYFSKEVIPHSGAGAARLAPVFQHVGIYAYTPAALQAYMAAGCCDLELSEGLEQLRFLWAGVPVMCVEVAARGRAFWEVNNPGDVSRVEEILRSEGRP